MSAAPSFKDVLKAINANVPTASLPLPDELVEVLERYIRKHEKFDETVAEKLNDELLAIYQKDIAPHPSKYAFFLHILRRLRPLIGQSAKTLRWWELFQPAFDHLNQEKDIAAESQGIVLDVLTSDDVDNVESPNASASIALAEKVLIMWVEECKVAGRADDALGNFKEKQLRDTLVIYGKKRPKDFMTLVSGVMVKKQWRPRTLHLMADFVCNQPPHLEEVLHTPLFETLVNCLQLDTSTTIVSLALTVLTMILPHMASSLVPHLPTLFNIYARLLFWERELSATEMGVDANVEQEPSPSASSWEKRAYSADFNDTSIPHLTNYFTILYGLYPINFMDYIRKPQRYLRHAEVPNADDIEVQPTEIRHASERFRQCHLLHENFYTLTIDSEKTDLGRWIKSEPAEIVADCMALFQTMDLGPSQVSYDIGVQGPHELLVMDDADRDGHESALLSSSFPLGSPSLIGTQGESWRSTHAMPVETAGSSRFQSNRDRQSSRSSRQSHRDSSSTRPSGNATDSPTLLAQLSTSGSYTRLQDMINSNKAIKSGLHQSLANDSVPSLALSHHESTPERPLSHLQPHVSSRNTLNPGTDSSTDTQIRHLTRQMLLLHNDLTFERFMKQQHLTHIGELRRRQLREAASEAETQNLIMVNRQLKLRVEEAKKAETQVRKDSEKSRTLAKKWEADLSSRLRTLREEQKKWLVERESLRSDLEVATIEAERLRALVCDAEVRELSWKQSIQSAEASSNELERLRTEVSRLEVSERDFQARETELQAAMARAEEAHSQVEILKMKVAAHETQLQQIHDVYQSQAVVLNAKLQNALKRGVGRNFDAGVKSQFESGLAASRTQQTQLKKRIAELTDKNIDLNSKILELQSTLSDQSTSHPPQPTSPDIDVMTSNSGRPLSFRNRQYGGLSDLDIPEATSPIANPPLDLYNPLTHVSSQTQRPSTPTGTDASSSVGKSSPGGERHHGRGGVQNTKKDNKDEMGR